MTITLELSTEQERLLKDGAAKADAEAVRRVLLQAVESAIEKFMRLSADAPRSPDFEALADRLAEDFAATSRSGHKALTDEAVTREGIYGDHP